MKLGTLRNDERDGRLIVVSEDLTKATELEGIFTLQWALDNWIIAYPILKFTYDALNKGQQTKAFGFNPTKMAAPLPRAYQWVDGSAYVNHVELVRKSRGVEMPESFWTDPLMYQGASDHMLGACEDVVLPTEKHGIDFEGEVAVITGDVPMGTSAEEARKLIRMVMLVNDVSLRYLAMNELTKGFGFVQCKPASGFTPVAVTPDSLGDAWKEGKLHLPLMVHYNGELFGKANAGVDMVFDFGMLVAHAALTRDLTAGTIVGSGTVSNKDRSVGSSCIVEKRTIEKLDSGESITPFMKFGDRVRIEMFDADGKSIFGAIDQKIVGSNAKKAAA